MDEETLEPITPPPDVAWRMPPHAREMVQEAMPTPEGLADAERVAKGTVGPQQDALGRFVAGNSIGKQWHKGQPSANPGGRPKAEVSLTAELKRRLAEATDDGRTIAARVADMLVAMALDGHIDALRYVGDRTDGKPAQAVTLSLDEGPLHYRLGVRDSGPRRAALPPEEVASD